MKSNPDNVVIIDEAYVDFGAESAVSLINKYDNLLVTQTFSKSRSMAGARLGFGIANKELIGDLNTIKYSTNPYNVNRMTIAAGAAAIESNNYYMDNCKRIIDTRSSVVERLCDLGFSVLNSEANFVFAKHNIKSGAELYIELKSKGILIRHFNKERISDYIRITIGTPEEMDVLISALETIIKEKN